MTASRNVLFSLTLFTPSLRNAACSMKEMVSSRWTISLKFTELFPMMLYGIGDVKEATRILCKLTVTQRVQGVQRPKGNRVVKDIYCLNTQVLTPLRANNVGELINSKETDKNLKAPHAN